MPTPAALVAEIRAETARQGLTTSALARRAGMRRQNLSEKLNGRRVITVPDFLAVATALQIPAFELFRRAESAMSLTGRERGEGR